MYSQFFSETYNTFNIVSESGKVLSHIRCFLTTDECIIISLYTEELFEGKGYGTLLLKLVENFATRNKVSKIIVDDCSDRFGQEKNIYVKFGFKYVVPGHPEMELKI